MYGWILQNGFSVLYIFMWIMCNYVSTICEIGFHAFSTLFSTSSDVAEISYDRISEQTIGNTDVCMHAAFHPVIFFN